MAPASERLIAFTPTHVCVSDDDIVAFPAEAEKVA
jgi:hypothetical protein